MSNNYSRLPIGNDLVALIDSLFVKKDKETLELLNHLTYKLIECNDSIEDLIDFDTIMMNDYAGDAYVAIDKGLTLDELHNSPIYKLVFD